jgi:hypothetical protein
VALSKLGCLLHYTRSRVRNAIWVWCVFLTFFWHFIAGNLVWLLMCLEIWFLTTTQQCARLFMIGFVPKFE